MMVNSELLIETVKQHPILFNFSHPEYKNNKKKDRVWHRLGLELGTSGLQLKKKWKNLRDSYAKYLKSERGDPNVRKSYVNWQWASLMDYFRPFMPSYHTIPEPTEDTMEDPLAAESEEETVVLKFEVNENDVGEPSGKLATTTTNGTNYRAPKRPAPSPMDSSMVDFLQKKLKTEISPVEMIFLGYAQTVKGFSLKRQAITKMKIAEVIMEQELLNYEEGSGTSVGANAHSPSGSD